MASETVLLAEEDADLLELMTCSLIEHGYEVMRVTRAEKALVGARKQRPDLVVINSELPKMKGTELCRRLRGDPVTKTISIILLSKHDRTKEVVRGLRLGADDYITLPLRPRIFVARVRAVLRGRRENGKPRELLEVGKLRIHPGRHEAVAGDQKLNLTPSEFRLLQLLASRPGKVYGRQKIKEYVRGRNHTATNRSVDVLVAGLREKMGDASECIETIRGVGYRLKNNKRADMERSAR